jgi:hypothetical protein
MIGYNLDHVQVATKTGSPTYLDVPAATTLNASITSDQDVFKADGKTYAIANSAPEGEGELGFGVTQITNFAIINGGTYSTSGTTPNIVDRYIQPGTTSQPTVILAAWIKDVDPNDTTRAGLRLVLPAASIAPVSASFEQESWAEWTADLSFVADSAINAMIIYELMETAPVFTGNVIPVTL